MINLLQICTDCTSRRGMRYHSLANIFPMMTGPELEALTSDIEKNGLLEPIVIYEGCILDGRNRYEACRRSGVTPRYVGLPPGTSPLNYVLSRNAARRSITPGQKACVAVNCIPHALMRLPFGSGTTAAVNMVAATFGISTRYVWDAKFLLSYYPDDFKAVLAGDTPLHVAAKRGRARLDDKRAAAAGKDDKDSGYRGILLNMVVTAIEGAGKGDVEARRWILDSEGKLSLDSISKELGINANLIKDWARAGCSTSPIHYALITSIREAIND